jgi:hypothetical protein
MLKLNHHDYVPLLAVLNSPLTMTDNDHVAMKCALEVLFTSPGFDERIRTRSHALDILGSFPHKENPRATLGIGSLLNSARASNTTARVRLELSSKMPLISEELSPSLIQQIASTIVTLPWEPWRLPTEAQMSEMIDLLEDPAPETWKSWRQALPRLR